MDTSESVSCNVDLLRRFIMTSVDQLQCNLRSYALTDRQVIVAGCECGMVLFSVASVCVFVCLSVCLSVVLRLLEILTYKVHFWHANTSSEYLGRVYIVKFIGQGQGRTSKKVCSCDLFWALNLQRLDLELSLLVCRYIFRISRSDSCIKAIGSKSRSRGQKSVPLSGYFSASPCIYCRRIRSRSGT